MVKIVLAFTAAALLLATHGSGVVAQELLAPPTAPVMEAPSVMEYAPPAPLAIECCPIAVAGEVASLSAKRSYRCNGGPTKQVICVDNPADCCRKMFSVPVCVPACCVDDPVCCDTRVGMLGRGYVTYRWACGFEATIAFRVHGGVLITYR